VTVEPAIPERMVCPQCRALFRGRFARCPRDGAALQAAVLDPLVGHTFADRYVVEDLLGEGGMGRVYRARHLRMSRRFAIKVLFGDQSANTKMVQRFTHEAEAASRLQHPNLVGVVDFGETDEGLLYLAMDYAAGPDLGLLIHRSGPMPGDRVLAIAAQLCDGLDHAHGRGLVHRDFKPDNIIIESGEHGDVARICDFGIAVLRENDRPTSERLTTDGLVVGTPHYMAPEQSVGDEVDPRTDLFALGVILYEMIAGVLPFAGSPAEVARLHLNVPAPPVARRVPGLAVDPLIEALAMRLMAKRPDDRPQSAREVGDVVRLIRTDRIAAARVLAVPTAPGEVLHTQPMGQIGHVTASGAVAKQRAETVNETPGGRTTNRDTEIDRPERRRGARYAALIALGVLGIGGGALLMRGGGEQAAVPPDAAPLLVLSLADAAAAPVDAAPEPVVVAIDAIDAGAAVVAEVPAPARRPRPTPAPAPRVEPVPDKPAPRPEPAPPVEPAPRPEPRPAIAELTGSLSQRYRTVGRRLDALVHARGESAAAPLKRRYLAIPYADAIRNPALATQVDAQLSALHRDVERALQ
jgi:serine/threonine protein kinase